MNTYSLPLFPLDVVVCPGGILPLKIFEASYLDMVRDCLRNKSSFAIVTILPEGETDLEGNFPFANVGTLVKIVHADVSTIGLMMIRCVGHHRVKIESFTKPANGLVIGEVSDIPNDLPMPIPEDLNLSIRVLKQLLDSLADQKLLPTNMPTVESYQFGNALGLLIDG
ncbi:MAG: LON peptidase substrate-binding domain-containing protein [Bacteroidia bacterium]|nr:LON peptidase substrate-binding domain-containing protein [Methylotenera sp.]